jgi:Tol biopolymer transport system component
VCPRTRRTDVNLSPEALEGSQGGQTLFSQAASTTAGDADIWSVDLDTRKERNLTEGSGRIEYFPQWWPARPDVIVFSSWSPDDDLGPSTGFLTVVHTDGSGYSILDEESQSNAHPAPAPDGRTIAYDRGGTAWLYRWDAGPEPFDPATFGLPVRRVGSPAWSPDGKRLAWVVGGDFDGKWQLGVGVFDLEAQTSLLLHPYEPVGVGGWPAAPVWSPDGQWLAYILWPADDPAEAGLWVFHTDGTEEHFLGAGSGPTWGPDGRWLSFSLDGEPGLWLAEVGAWRPRQIVLPPSPSAVTPVQRPVFSHGEPSIRSSHCPIAGRRHI